ncbi:MAG: hypothetical protein O3A00_01295 [Planctomycetota bacterium]|nr:hypothetical protein [Planctomycetota bacterium]
MRDVELGGLTFRIEYRSTGADRGPAIRVFGNVDGQAVQLLRFDCFEDDPHFHYDPVGKNVKFHLDPLTMGDALEFSLRQIGSVLRAMIAKAGFAEFAESVDEDAVRGSIGRIRSAIDSESRASPG